MKTLIFTAFMVTLALPQDEPQQTPQKPRITRRIRAGGRDSVKTAEVEVRTLEEVKPALAEKPESPRPGEKFDLARTGIEWHKGLEAVLDLGKPILLLQILGNYDEVYC